MLYTIEYIVMNSSQHTTFEVVLIKSLMEVVEWGELVGSVGDLAGQGGI